MLVVRMVMLKRTEMAMAIEVTGVRLRSLYLDEWPLACLWLVLHILDLAITRIGVAHGAQEINPLLAYWINNQMWLEALLVKMGFAAVFIVGIMRIPQYNYRVKLLRAANYAVGVITLWTLAITYLSITYGGM